MRAKGAMFGGELSGHFYFGENFTADSGMIAMMSVLSLLTAPEHAGKSLGQLVASVRRYHSTGEINFHVEDKAGTIAALKKRYSQGRADELDGITVEFGELGRSEWWWFNVRPSNTEPLLRMIVEASSAKLRDQKKAELIGLLGTPE
jgi:phosphomannomutase